jgi:hypothetical protein
MLQNQSNNLQSTIHTTPSEANNPMNRIDIKIIPYRIIDLTDMPTTGTSLLIGLAGGKFQRNIGSVIRQEEQMSIAGILSTLEGTKVSGQCPAKGQN